MPCLLHLILSLSEPNNEIMNGTKSLVDLLFSLFLLVFFSYCRGKKKLLDPLFGYPPRPEKLWGEKASKLQHHNHSSQPFVHQHHRNCVKGWCFNHTAMTTILPFVTFYLHAAVWVVCPGLISLFYSFAFSVLGYTRERQH